MVVTDKEDGYRIVTITDRIGSKTIIRKRGYIVLYEHDDYRGQSIKYYVDSGKPINLPSSWNNKVSSLKGFNGPFHVELYDERDGFGLYNVLEFLDEPAYLSIADNMKYRDSIVLDDYDSTQFMHKSLSWDGYNDLATSLRLINGSNVNAGKYIEIYTEPNFRGLTKRINLPAGNNGSVDLTGSFYRTVSSIKVFGAADVYLYDSTEGYGRDFRFSMVTKGGTNLSDIRFDNKITEIVFAKNPRHYAILYDGKNYKGSYRVVRWYELGTLLTL